MKPFLRDACVLSPGPRLPQGRLRRHAPPQEGRGILPHERHGQRDPAHRRPGRGQLPLPPAAHVPHPRLHRGTQAVCGVPTERAAGLPPHPPGRGHGVQPHAER
eukprot:528352-Alexandrium_andersonii.AAC.1